MNKLSFHFHYYKQVKEAFDFVNLYKILLLIYLLFFYLHYIHLIIVVEEYLSALPPERLQAEAHAQAEEALAEIFDILEDPELDDPACMQKIEAIVTVYHRRLGVHSTRHWEQD